jgi:uncharacterized protein (UPF0335 family)
MQPSLSFPPYDDTEIKAQIKALSERIDKLEDEIKILRTEAEIHKRSILAEAAAESAADKMAD